MRAIGNDTWRAPFTLHELGVHRFTVTAWIDAFASWRHAFARRTAPADVEDALRDGAELVRAAARARARRPRARMPLLALAASLEARTRSTTARACFVARARRADGEAPGPSLETHYDRELDDRGRAAARALLVLVRVLPALRGGATAAHGTFATCEARLDYVAEMGFDVLYLPPIHPIGATKRKGPNNALDAAPDDPGSPWAIGGREGGHTSVHPQLGTLADFRQFRAEAERLGIEVALDIAFQCSPDHPYVSEHPDWFQRRRDGSDAVRGKPAEEIRGHLPVRFRERRMGVAVARAARRRSSSG